MNTQSPQDMKPVGEPQVRKTDSLEASSSNNKTVQQQDIMATATAEAATLDSKPSAPAVQEPSEKPTASTSLGKVDSPMDAFLAKEDAKDGDDDGDDDDVEALSAKREYNRVCAAKSRANRKKKMSELEEQVQEASGVYEDLARKNKGLREDVDSLIQNALYEILGIGGSGGSAAATGGTVTAQQTQAAAAALLANMTGAAGGTAPPAPSVTQNSVSES